MLALVLGLFFVCTCLAVTVDPLTHFLESITLQPTDADADMTMEELIRSKGYPVIAYTILTEDGYLLRLHRIPHGRHLQHTSGIGKRPPVLLAPSASASSAEFVVNFPHQSLGFILADAGYDVWLVNVRGTTGSQGHLLYTVNDTRYWDFSYEEIGTMDLAACVDHILLTTGVEKLFFIPYSFSGTCSLALLSLRPEYNRKIRAMMMLGPIAFTTYGTSVMNLLPYVQNFYYPYFNATSFGEFGRSTPESARFLRALCRSPFNFLCVIGYEMIGGEETNKEFNRSRIAVYTSQGFTSTSAKTLVHFGQNQKSLRFNRFDYGMSENLRRYGQVVPPDYPLWRIDVPVVFFTSEVDVMADAKDLTYLRPRMARSLVAELRISATEKFSHLDFVLGKEAHRLVYEPLLRIMSTF